MNEIVIIKELDATGLFEVYREFEFSEKDYVRPICTDWNSIYEEFHRKDGNEGIVS